MEQKYPRVQAKCYLVVEKTAPHKCQSRQSLLKIHTKEIMHAQRMFQTLTGVSITLSLLLGNQTKINVRVPNRLKMHGQTSSISLFFLNAIYNDYMPFNTLAR